MKTIVVGNSNIHASEIALGCMRITKIAQEKAVFLIRSALEHEINFFDHADIYARGESEKVFGQIMQTESIDRDKIFIQSKCGIREGFFDFSKEHILQSVDGSLQRLGTDYLDVLLLHRPDALVEPEEVAEAFSILHASGKVRHFGVSNQRPMQIELLRKYVKQPIIANQLQLSIAHSNMISSGFYVNMDHEHSDLDGSVLDYCRLHDITVQAWSPFQYGFFAGIFLDNPLYVDLNSRLQEIAEAHRTTKTAVAIAWILRHPATIQTIAGTMNLDHLEEICAASDVFLSRIEWYDICKAAGNVLP